MMTPMTVEWHDSRWPKPVSAILRLLRPKAGQGALRLCLDEPGALGRMTLKDRDGQILCRLIDSASTKEKYFYLPSSLAEHGFLLQNEKEETLFAWNLQELNLAADSLSAGQTSNPKQEGGETP